MTALLPMNVNGRRDQHQRLAAARTRVTNARERRVAMHPLDVADLAQLKAGAQAAISLGATDWLDEVSAEEYEGSAG